MNAPKLELKKNSKTYKKLDSLAKKHNLGVKELMLNETYQEEVCDIIYQDLPVTIRFLVKRKSFSETYAKSKEQIVNMFV